MKRILPIVLCLLLLSSCSGLLSPEATPSAGWTPIIKKNLGTGPIIENLSTSIGSSDFVVVSSEWSIRVEFTDVDLGGIATMSKESGSYTLWDERISHYLSMNDYALASIVGTSSKDKAVSLVVRSDEEILLTIADHQVLYDSVRESSKNKNGPDITFDEFIQLYEGMHYEEVTAIIGSPGDAVGDGVYIWNGKDGLSSATLSFQDDILFSMEQNGLMPSGGGDADFNFGGGFGRPGFGGGYIDYGGGGVVIMPADSVSAIRIG